MGFASGSGSGFKQKKYGSASVMPNYPPSTVKWGSASSTGGGGGGGGGGMGYFPPPSQQFPPPQVYKPPQASYPPQPMAPPPQAPPQMPYQPHSPAASKLAGAMGRYGQGLMDPNSDLARRMQEELTRRIGKETEAGKRLAAFQASQSGMGGGETPELMAMMGDIDIAGTEAGADAASGMMTQLPQLGLGFMQGGLQGELGISGQDLQAWLGQQRMNQQQYTTDMESYYRGQDLDLRRRQAEMNQFAMMF